MFQSFSITSLISKLKSDIGLCSSTTIGFRGHEMVQISFLGHIFSLC